VPPERDWIAIRPRESTLCSRIIPRMTPEGQERIKDIKVIKVPFFFRLWPLVLNEVPKEQATGTL
jgi:hypothetical protein